MNEPATDKSPPDKNDVASTISSGAIVRIVKLFAFAASAYLGFFAILYVDELVLGTQFIQTILPSSVVELLDRAYSPLTKLLGSL